MSISAVGWRVTKKDANIFFVCYSLYFLPPLFLMERDHRKSGAFLILISFHLSCSLGETLSMPSIEQWRFLLPTLQKWIFPISAFIRPTAFRSIHKTTNNTTPATIEIRPFATRTFPRLLFHHAHSNYLFFIHRTTRCIIYAIGNHFNRRTCNINTSSSKSSSSTKFIALIVEQAAVARP